MPTSEFSDNFNRADNDSLGANWTELNPNCDVDIVSNTAQLASRTSGNGAILCNVMPSSADCYAETEYGYSGGTVGDTICVRGTNVLYNGGSWTGYFCQYRAGGNNDVFWVRFNSGTSFLLLEDDLGVAPTNNTPYRVTVETVGSTVVLKLYENGVEISTVTDSDASRITDNGYIQLSVGAAVGLYTDNFDMGILADTGTATKRNDLPILGVS